MLWAALLYFIVQPRLWACKAGMLLRPDACGACLVFSGKELSAGCKLGWWLGSCRDQLLSSIAFIAIGQISATCGKMFVFRLLLFANLPCRHS